MVIKFLKNRVVAGILVGLIITFSLSIGIFTDSFASLDRVFSNNLYSYNSPSDKIVIVAIDGKTTENPPIGMGLFQKWTRDKYAVAIDKIIKGNPKVLGIDFIFNTSSDFVAKSVFNILENEIDSSDSNKDKLELYQKFVQEYKSSLNDPLDNQLAAVLASGKNIVLDAMIDGNGGIVKPLPKFSSNTTLGIVNVSFDDEGRLRSIKPRFFVEQDDATYDHFALAVAKKYLDQDDINIPLDKEEMNANFFGDPFSFPMFSFVDVVNGKIDQEIFKDKIVLVGTTDSASVHDEYYTPKSNSTPMPGVEILANQIQTILDGKFLVNQSKISEVVVITTLSILLTVIFNYLSITFSTLLALATLALYYASAHYFYRKGLILNMVYPFLAIILSYIGAFVYRYFVADKDKRQITSAFGHYVSKKLVDQISENPDMVKLGGEKRIVTVFFSDVKNSTTLSEQTEISSWVSQMNEYFTVMERILQKYDGTIDKYEGDAMMGFWNAPIPQANHQELAYSCVLEMKSTLLSLHQKWQAEGKPLIDIRIGVNTGEAIVGNFGSVGRFDYTVMGDTVNVASRLESSANKTYGTSVMTAGGSYQNFLIREIDTVLLPGKNSPINLYELISAKSTATAEQQQMVSSYQNGLLAYRKKDFTTAITEFSKTPNDPASQTMLKRCEALQKGQAVAGLGTDMVFRIANK